MEFPNERFYTSLGNCKRTEFHVFRARRLVFLTSLFLIYHLAVASMPRFSHLQEVAEFIQFLFSQHFFLNFLSERMLGAVHIHLLNLSLCFVSSSAMF